MLSDQAKDVLEPTSDRHPLEGSVDESTRLPRSEESSSPGTSRGSEDLGSESEVRPSVGNGIAEDRHSIPTDTPAGEGQAPEGQVPEGQVPEDQASEGQAASEDSEASNFIAQSGGFAPKAAADKPALHETSDAEAAGAGIDDAEVGDAELEADEQAAGDASRPVKPIEEIVESSDDFEMSWYILKVQSNRERSIAEALQRKVAVEGLDRYFGQIIVPTEKVTEFKGGKKKIVERKLWPGYIVVQMHITDDTWFAVRETSGIGDFTGAAGKPTPMQPHEVARIIQTEEEETEETPRLNVKFKEGDRVKVREGNFENFEGEVGSIDEASGRVTVMINIFGRSTPVELEYWQIESL
jgi:transcriptional antiterminator NusG